MNRKEILTQRRSFILKVTFLVMLLILSALMYVESGMVIDVIYFAVVLVTLIRFLMLKLYH